jgi:MSHA biogenesis protein MshL
MRKTLLILFIFSLTACSNVMSPKRDTYDQINAEMNKGIDGNMKPAQADAVSASLLPPLKIELPKSRKAGEERFNLTFSNAPAQQFFMSIASGTRYNMMVHPDVSGAISATLKDVTLFEALDAIRELYGYEYKVEGTRIYIKPLSLQTAIFRVNYLNYNRKGASDIRVTNGSVTDTTQSGSPTDTTSNAGTGTSTGTGTGTTTLSRTSAKITTTSSSNFWGELKMALESIVGNKEGRSVIINPRSGVVLIRGMSDELRNVSAFLKATQLSVDRQVILEAKIMEVELSDGFQSGVNWAAFGGGSNKFSAGFMTPGGTVQNSGTLTSGTGATAAAGSSLALSSGASNSLLGLAFQSSHFASMISFLETQGSVHVLSSPRIATMNNEKAVLKVGTDEFFVTEVTTTQTTTGSSTTQPTTSVKVQPFFSGVSLDVTPQIDDDDNIVLHVHPSVSLVSTVTKEINLGANNGGTLSLPLASSAISETDSVVRGKTGNIIAIGGLMRQSSVSDRSQLPGMGELPVVGNLFRNTNRATQKRELVILIKPTIVQSGGNWAQDMIETRNRLKTLEPPAVKGLQ